MNNKISREELIAGIRERLPVDPKHKTYTHLSREELMEIYLALEKKRVQNAEEPK